MDQLPSSYEILRRAETEARFFEWDGSPYDAAHRREVATNVLVGLGLSPDWIKKQWGLVVSTLNSELEQKI